MSGNPDPRDGATVAGRMAHQRDVDNLAITGLIVVSLLTSAAVALFAGGDVGLLVAPALLILSTVATVALVRGGLRVIAGSRRPR